MTASGPEPPQAPDPGREDAADAMGYYLDRIDRIDRKPRWAIPALAMLSDRKGASTALVAGSMAVAALLAWVSLPPSVRMRGSAPPPLAAAPEATTNPSTEPLPVAATISPDPRATSMPARSIRAPQAVTPEQKAREPRAKVRGASASVPTLNRERFPPQADPNISREEAVASHAAGPAVALHGAALRRALAEDRILTRDANRQARDARDGTRAT